MKLTLEQKIGQLFLVGIRTKKDIPAVINLVKTHYIGGVVLSKASYSNYKEMLELVNSLKEANDKNPIPLFIAIDQEGGRVNRFPDEFEVIKNAYAFENKDEGVARNRAKIISEVLTKSGINMNLDPVLDLKKQKDEHAIGNRGYSKDPKEVIRLTKPMMSEYKKNNIVAVAKHFVGQGSLRADSHFFLPRIKNVKSLYNEDLIPFKEAFKEDIPGIIVGHIRIKGKNRITPLTLSKKYLNKMLREELKYNNLIITDDLFMKSVRYLYGTKRSVIKAIDAGVDMIMNRYKEGLEKRLEKSQENTRKYYEKLDEEKLKQEELYDK